MYERVLVPTDGSEHATRAARHASRLAVALDSEVHLLGVVDLEAVAGPFSAGGLDRRTREVFEEKTADRIRETAEHVDGVETHQEVRVGQPAETIAEYADEVGADLLAMGTHGRTGVGRFVLGSVTENVLRLVDAPVLTVRAEDRGTPDEPAENVLVPTDGSDRAATAVPHALALAGVDEARVHAVSVVDDTADVGRTTPGTVPEPAPAIDEIREDLADRASEVTAAIAREAEDAGLEAVSAVRYGHPAEELLAYVDEAEIDLVAMGTQGRTGLNRYLLGSTTERVVRHAPVPVVAVNAREQD